MKTYKIVIGAAETQVLKVSGWHFRILAAEAPVDVKLTYSGNAESTAVAVDQGFWSSPTRGFDQVEITSATAQTLKICVAQTESGYDAIASSVTIAGGVTLNGGSIAVSEQQYTTLAHSAALNVGTTATPVVAAKAGRGGLRVFNASVNTIYLGGAGVTAANAAIRLDPFGYMDETQAASAAWYAVASAAASELRVMEVL